MPRYRIAAATFVICAMVEMFAAAQSPSSSAQTSFSQGGMLLLTQDFGRAVYTKCRLAVYFLRPFLQGTDRIELSCTPLPYPLVDDVFAMRLLTAAESDMAARLAVGSDLYSGGHVGRFSGSEGPWERLEVRCCGRVDTVVLITDGNATFSTGSRRDLLNLLSKWRAELMPKVQKAK